MPIGLISDGESGSSCRTKINSSFTLLDAESTIGRTIVEAANSAAVQKAILDTSGPLALPFVVAFKDVTVLTTGSPSDVASISLPSWLTRWRFAPSGSAICMAESASGTLAGASFIIQSASGGGGAALNTAFAGPASTSVVVLPTAASTGNVPTTTSTIYLRQTADSANTGVISVYLTIIPCL